MSFDWNKLDSYKVALDDGFTYMKTNLECSVDIYKNDDTYILTVAYTGFDDEANLYLDTTDWKEFKKKIADYFLKS